MVYTVYDPFHESLYVFPSVTPVLDVHQSLRLSPCGLQLLVTFGSVPPTLLVTLLPPKVERPTHPT